MSAPTDRTPAAIDAYDRMTLALHDVSALAEMQEEVARMRGGNNEAILRGLGAVARLTLEKLKEVEAGATSLLDAVKIP